MSDRQWTPTPWLGRFTDGGGEFPEKNRAIRWIAPSGEVVEGAFLGGSVWMPAGSAMYVYYTPTFWQYVEG